MGIYISIIIPAYNEEKKIADTLTIIVEYLNQKRWNAEILVIEDGSKDNTAKIIREIAQHHDCIHLIQNNINKGKGYSVKQGVLAARGEFILFTDADNSTPIEEVEKLLFALENSKCDIAIGSRSLPKSRIEIPQPFYRKIMGKVFNIFVRMILKLNIKDTQCGFKCFPQNIARQLFQYQRLERFGFDAEILFLAQRHRYHIKEIPILWKNRMESRVHIIKDSIRMLMELCIVKRNHLLGLY